VQVFHYGLGGKISKDELFYIRLAKRGGGLGKETGGFKKKLSLLTSSLFGGSQYLEKKKIIENR